MSVAPRTLKVLAMLVWYIGGVVLLLKGRSLLGEADVLRAGEHWQWLAPVLGIVAGGLKGGLLFRRSCHKNLARIDALDDPKAWQFFRPQFFFLLFLMIAAGATLSRLAHGNYPFLIAVAILDLSIAVALLSSSYVFWKHKVLVPGRVSTWLPLLVALLPLHASLSHGQTHLEVAFPNLSFVQPVDFQTAGDGSDRIFVVEQRGVIRVFDNSPAVTQSKVFLDIQDRVNDTGFEEGLLGLTFHPDYQNNGDFYVDYTASTPRRTVVARYSVSGANPDSAVHASEFVILEVAQPFSNHNGGQIAFGPDGFLYIALGDGGGSGDPVAHGQNRQTLLGSLLRIDVDTTTVSTNYGIPTGNPFVGNQFGYREEIFAWGLRNPWRFSFDTFTERLWLADVGQGNYEEVDVIESGKNYGWNIMEGFHCFNPSTGCDMTGLALPVWEYDHSLGRSITGGYVYAGTRRPDLWGEYIYGDYITGRIWALEWDGMSAPVNTELIDTTLNISSFGVDESKELYICAFDGKIYQFQASATGVPDDGGGSPRFFSLGQNVPNPFNPSTAIPYTVPDDGVDVTLRIYDATGRVVRTLFDGHQPAGRKLATWDGTDGRGQRLATGVYFYQLKAAGFTETRKMVLVK